MTLQQVDEVLKGWKVRLNAVADNLLELQTESTYQSLTGTGGLNKAAVTGLTAKRVEPALRTVNVLFQQFGLLQGTIEKAEALRGGLPAMFGGDAKARELQAVLFGRSIEVQTVAVPLAERSLLSGALQVERLAPEELLGVMTRTFAEVRDAVADVGRAWTAFAESSELVEKEIERLRGQCALPAATLSGVLQDVEAKLGHARAGMATDPLSAVTMLEAQVKPALASASARVTVAEALGQKLRAARAQWDACAGLHREAVDAVAEAEGKVTNGEALPAAVPEDKGRSVGEWLGRLEAKAAEGAVEAVGVGLRNWTAALDACTAEDRRALEASQSRLGARGELRGRMEALKAKARAYGVAETGELAALSGVAEQLLYARPVDLTTAGAAVGRYEQQLRGTGSKGSKESEGNGKGAQLSR